MKNYHAHWFFEILPASRNLDCWGCRIGELYFDFYPRHPGLGLFVKMRNVRKWIPLF